MMAFDETKSHSLDCGVRCNSGHTGVYLAGKQPWDDVNKISVVRLASHRQLLLLERQREGNISPNAFSCLYKRDQEKGLKMVLPKAHALEHPRGRKWCRAAVSLSLAQHSQVPTCPCELIRVPRMGRGANLSVVPSTEKG